MYVNKPFKSKRERDRERKLTWSEEPDLGWDWEELEGLDEGLVFPSWWLFNAKTGS